jgi:peptide deformylase
MAIRSVLTYPNPALREPTEKIECFDDEIRSIVSDMWETMYAADGIGLAGPQIGVAKKVIVIDYHGEKYVLINPEILEKNGSVTNEEGCLSFPGIYEKVESPESMRVKYYDENGKEHEKVVEGFLSCVFSHEIDHLYGKLLIDRVSPLKRQFLKKRIAKRTSEAI